MSGIAIAVAFLAGVLLRDSGAGWVIAALVGGGGVLGMLLSDRRSDRLLVAFVFVFFVLGTWRAHSNPVATNSLSAYIDANHEIEATVVGTPRHESRRVLVNVHLLGDGSRSLKVSLPPYPEVTSGDTIAFRISPALSRSEFDSASNPNSQNINSVFATSFEIEQSPTNPLVRFRNATNNLLTTSIDEHVPEPAASLTLGILNGDDAGMTDATHQRFAASGMSHITAVSGWNVALVAGLISIGTRRLAPTSLVTLLSGMGIVWTYAFIVGMGPSVSRAATMATVFLLARWRGRPGDLLTSLLITVAAFVALTPSIRFDIGFQLSVAATLGIVLFVEQYPLIPSWQSALALPFVAQIATTPLQLHHFGSFSLLAPLANLIVAPFVGLVMLGGVATVLASLIHPSLADVTGVLAWLPARFIFSVADREPAVLRSSGAMFELSWGATFVIYVLLALVVVAWSARLKVTRLRQRLQSANAGI